MSDIKWIKIATDIFNDEKIQVIEEMPEGKTLICVWFKLLCLAGKSNKCGWIFIADRVPYTEQTLVSVLREKPSIIKLALKTFERFGMIEIADDGTIGISNWQKHQAVESMETIREKARKRVAEWRDSSISY